MRAITTTPAGLHEPGTSAARDFHRAALTHAPGFGSRPGGPSAEVPMIRLAPAPHPPGGITYIR
jgi:hypothetical protein